MKKQQKTKVAEIAEAVEMPAATLELEQHPVPMEQPVHQPAVQTGDEAYMVMIAKAASDPNTDVDKFERLIALQEKVFASRALAAYNSAYVKMKPHLPLVLKDKYNSQTKSNYAKMETINQAVEPILGKFGFGLSFETILQDKDGITLKAILRHEGGHITETPVWMPYDTKGIAGTVNKTMPHAISSSILYCRRVGACMLLNISTGDDVDGNTDQTPQQTANANFANKMNPRKPSPAEEHASEGWDGRIVKDGKTMATLLRDKSVDFLIPTFTKFLNEIETSEKRLDLINQNIGFISALVEAKLGGEVAKFNQIAKEGK